MCGGTQEGDIVVEARMNRLAKNLKHMLELAQNLEKRNVHIVSLDYNFDTRIATGKMLLHIIEGVAEWERELLKEKQRVGLDIVKKGDSGVVLVSVGRNMKGWNMLSIYIWKVISSPIFGYAKLHKKYV